MPHTGLRKLLAAGLLSASLWLPQGGFTAPLDLPERGIVWIYTKKVDTKQDFILHFSKHKGGMVSMTHRPYDEDFKKSIVALYQNGKTQSQLSKEYGVSLSAIGNQ